MDLNPHYFVLAPSFHGATLLAMLLSNHPDVVALGDTNPPRPQTRCLCGERVADCPFWSVVGQGDPSMYTSTSRKMMPTVPDLTARYSVNVRLTTAISVASISSSASAWRIAASQFDAYVTAWAAFRKAALEASGARLLVDGEKSVAKFLAFRSITSRGCNLIHLTRDPRAFVHSVNKRRARAGRNGKTLAECTSVWKRSHKRILRARLGLHPQQYCQIRYEDLAEHPVETMGRLLAFMGLPEQDVIGTKPQNSHLIGNDGAFSSFQGGVQLDSSWTTELSSGDKEDIYRMAEPLASRLGYRYV
jgi:hypothetical protein